MRLPDWLWDEIFLKVGLHGTLLSFLLRLQLSSSDWDHTCMSTINTKCSQTCVVGVSRCERAMPTSLLLTDEARQCSVKSISCLFYDQHVYFYKILLHYYYIITFSVYFCGVGSLYSVLQYLFILFPTKEIIPCVFNDCHWKVSLSIFNLSYPLFYFFQTFSFIYQQ